MTNIIWPADRDELVAVTRQLRAAYAMITDPAPGDDVLGVDTSGPVQAITVSDALYAAWEATYGGFVEPAIELDPPPVRVETAAADEKPKRRRTPKKSSKTDTTRGA